MAKPIPGRSSAVILPEGTTGTHVMKGADVRYKLHGKLDPAVIEVIAQIAEINHTNMKAIAELATMQDQMLNVIQQFADVAHNMKERTDQMVRATQQLNEPMDGETN